MPISPQREQEIEPGDCIIIEENPDYCRDAIKFGGTIAKVTKVGRNALGYVQSIFVEEDGQRYNWSGHISEVLKATITFEAASNEELMVMLSNT